MIVDASLVIDAIADPGSIGAAARAALAAQPAAEPLIAPGHFAFEIMSGLGAAANRPGHPLQTEEIPDARHETTLLTSDARIERSGAEIHCAIVTVISAG